MPAGSRQTHRHRTISTLDLYAEPTPSCRHDALAPGRGFVQAATRIRPCFPPRSAGGGQRGPGGVDVRLLLGVGEKCRGGKGA